MAAQKSTGIDMEQNYVTVTLRIGRILCSATVNNNCRYFYCCYELRLVLIKKF